MKKSVLFGGAMVILVSAVVAWRVVASGDHTADGPAGLGEPPPGYSQPRPLDDERRALLDRVVPRPSCPSAEPMPQPADDEVFVDHFRVEDGCLVLHSEVVAADAAFARIEELRAKEGVVSADLRPTVEYDQEDELDLTEEDLADLRDLADLDPDVLWPYAELRLDEIRALAVASARRPVRVGLIDSAVDRLHPELQGSVPSLLEGHADGSGGGHGTNMASVIAARDEEVARGGPLRRLAPEVEIVSSDYGDRGFQLDPLTGLADEITRLVDEGVDVINMSFRIRCVLPDSSWLCGDENALSAIETARKAGVVVIASGGNSGEEGSPQQWPAAFEGVIAVSNHDRDGRHNPRSSANDDIDISAPGTDVLMAGFVLNEETDVRHCRDGYHANGALWCVASGASPAAAFVSGAVAWLKARHPNASPAAIERALYEGAHLPDGQEQGERSDEFGHGYLDPLAADELLGHEQGGGPLVAYRADVGQTLAVAHTASGQRAVLAHVEGSMGIPADPVRWSPTGRRLAGRTRGGTVTVWDADALLFHPGDLSDGPPAELEAMLTYPPGSPGCILDFAFVDDATIVALEAPGFMDSSTCGPTGTQLRTYDVASGSGGDPITTPPLDNLVGVLDDGSILAAGAAGPEAPATFAWLDPTGSVRKTVEVAGTAGYGTFLEPLLSPDRRSVAQMMRADDGSTGIVVLDVEEGQATTTPLPDASNGETVQGLRWADAETLVASLEITGTAAPTTPGDHRLWALRDGNWHQLDGNPLVAGRAVGYRTQVVVTAAEEIVNDGWAYGHLHVLHNRPYGEAGDVYADPTNTDAPLATGVDQTWPSPADPPERPFLLP